MTGTINFSELAPGTPALNDPIPFWSAANSVSQRTTRAGLQGQINPNVFNVADYGAVPYDGSSAPFNCHDAIAQAVAAATEVGGGTIYFPALYAAWPVGRGSSVVVNAPNITFQGAGWQTGIIIPNLPSRVFPYTLLGLTVNSQNFQLRDLALYGSQISTDWVGFDVDKIVRGVFITNPAGTSFDDTPFTANWLFDNVLWGCWEGTYGFAVAFNNQNANKVTIQHCQVNSQITDNELFGYAFNIPGIDMTIFDCDIFPVNGNLARHGTYIADPCVSLKIINTRYKNLSREAFTSNQISLDSRDILIQGCTFTDCVGVGAPPVTGVIDIAGVADFTIDNNTITTTDTSLWGQTSGISLYVAQDGDVANVNGIISNNRITRMQRHGVDIQNAININCYSNQVESVGLDGVADAFHVESQILGSPHIPFASTHVYIYNNQVTINDGETLHALINIDETAPLPTNVQGVGNTYILNGSGSVTSEFLNCQEVVGGFFRSGNIPSSGISSFSQSDTPDVSGGINLLTLNSLFYQTVSIITGGIDGQIIYLRAATTFVKIINGQGANHIQMGSNNDLSLRPGQILPIIFSANAGQWYQAGAIQAYEYLLPPSSGRQSVGDITYDLGPVGSGYTSFVCTTAGFGTVDDDLWAMGRSAVAFSTIYWYGTNVYYAQTTGTCGSTPPTWTSGTQSDGGVQWMYLDVRAVFAHAGPLQPTFPALISGSINFTRVSDTYAAVDTTSGPVDVNLDFARNHPATPVYVSRIAGTADLIIIPAPGGDTINGSASAYIPHGANAVILIPDSATNWVAVIVQLAQTPGTFTANGATPVAVGNILVTSSSAIIFTLKTVGGTVGAYPTIETITPGTGFTVAATAGDTSVYNYLILG